MASMPIEMSVPELLSRLGERPELAHELNARVREARRPARLCRLTLETALSRTKWMTVSQVTDCLDQCGPLAFASREEHDDYRNATRRRRYDVVYNGLRRLRHTVGVDFVLGSDDGREVGVYMYVEPANWRR